MNILQGCKTIQLEIGLKVLFCIGVILGAVICDTTLYIYMYIRDLIQYNNDYFIVFVNSLLVTKHEESLEIRYYAKNL